MSRVNLTHLTAFFISMLLTVLLGGLYPEASMKIEVLQSSDVPSNQTDLVLEDDLEENLYKELINLYNLLNQTKTFTVVGGEGDSGTRAIWSLLDTYGVKMGNPHNQDIKRDTKDSKIFMDSYSTTINNEHFSFGAAKFYFSGLKARREGEDLLFNEASLSETLWKEGMLFTAKMVSTVLKKHCQDLKECEYVGFKHPRSLLLLPYLIPLIGDKLRIIHVIRDGREVTLANNRKFYNTLCNHYYYQQNNRNNCDNSLLSRLLMWSDLNIEIQQYCKHNKQYMLTHIEDIVSGNISIFKQIYFNIFQNELTNQIWNQIDMNQVISEFKQHSGSYFGNKLDGLEKTQLNVIIKESNRIRKAFQSFGYLE